MDEGGSSHDNRCISSTYSPPDGSQWSSPSRVPQDRDSDSPSRDQVHSNIIRDKNNISKTADRREVVSRLNQICDYIKQTSYLMDTLKNSENSNLVDLESNCSSARGSVGASPGSNFGLSRASSQGRCQSESAAVLLQGCDRDELRMKVEESQRKLQALQDHQAALASLQDKARQQLHEARQEQTALMIHCSVGDTSDVPLEDDVKLDQLQRRLHSLAEMCHNRNQLAAQLGELEGEDELLPEQLVLQNKLQQLQSKKRHMDHLVAALHTNNNNSSSATASATAAGNATAATTVASSGLRENDGAVTEKITELNLMKQQLAHLKDLVASVERNKDTGEGGLEEQAVNLRRQNVRGSSVCDDVPTDIHTRTQRLQDAHGRLEQLQELVGLVGDAHASGRPLPDQYLDSLLCDSSSSPHRDIIQLDKNASNGQELYRSISEKKTNSQSQRQLLALELQAKRLELEALMSKDQGLPSAVNQDKPHTLLRGYGEGTTSGTWGGSTQGTIEDLADPDLHDHSLCYSSDEGVIEEEEDADPFPGLQLSASVLGQPAPTNREALDISVSMGPASSPQPQSQPPVGVTPRLSWTVTQEAVCSQVAPPPGDNVPASVSHPSVLSSTASTSNVWKPSHLQGEGQQQGNWGMIYSPLPGDSYYQQLLATSQIQQQNMVLTMLNQCCQLLWLQQRDLQALRSAVHVLQEQASGQTTEVTEAARCGNAGYGLFLPTQEDVQLNNCFPPTPALNNQVPPGNRANNYWDNFRSYSRQNLLSTNTGKSNEGLAGASHSPSPLVERSHNSLQSTAHSLGTATLPLQPEQLPQPITVGRKEKLNADQRQRGNTLNQHNEANTSTAVKKKRHPNPKITSMSPRNTHKKGREPVGDEVAALISANQNRPDFLLHLFRELRALHSEPLRQDTGPSIHRPAQQSMAHEEMADCLDAGRAPPVDDVKVNGFKTFPTTDWEFPNLQSDITSTFCRISTGEVEEGDSAAAAAAVVVPEPLPRNAAWKMKDLLTATPELQLVAQGQGRGQSDWRVQSVVAELRPLLRAHQDDTCTPALLETLRRAAVGLLPQPQPDSYCCNQLDSLLHDALVHFQHCRLGSVGEQLLAVVADVLQTELNFLQQAGQVCGPPSPTPNCNSVDGDGACGGEELIESHLHLLDVTAVTQVGPEPAQASDMYNGDLAEADQSCHTDRDGVDNSCDGEVVLEATVRAVSDGAQCDETDVGTEDLTTAACADSDDKDSAPARSNTPGLECP